MEQINKYRSEGATPLEKKAHKDYNHILSKVIEPCIGKKTTFMNDIHDLCDIIFEKQWAGIYSRNRIPKLTNKKPYCICNLDLEGEAGSHWVGLYKDGKEILVYDSFGRANKEILPVLSKNRKTRETDRDVEQDIEETNCGARCIAWLCLVKYYGVKSAELI